VSPAPETQRPATEGPSLEDAISALEREARSPRAHATLKTLRDELNITDKRKQAGTESPGRRAAQASGSGDSFGRASAAALQRFKEK
jgi:hypothetical protein